MAKIDVYLRSIERFGATGAVLTSGQAVALKFPTGDRHATQVTPHDQVVAMVREVAPPAIVDLVDSNRPGKFEYDSGDRRYAVSVAPKVGSWQVTIEQISDAPARPVTQPIAFPRTVTPPKVTPPDEGMAIERGQYDGSVTPPPSPGGASGALLLDQLTRAARAARATDLYLVTGTQALHRVNGELVNAGGSRIDGDQLSREIGIVAPGDARSRWTEHGYGVFTYGDGVGRIRVTLGRDHRGPSAALRLLPDEPPALETLGMGPVVEGWLNRKGLVVVAGGSGAGKTVTLAALVRALAERRLRVICIEDPIELVHASPYVSQRAIGPHVESVTAGVAAAMNEGADAIVVGRVTSAATAQGVVEAVAGGHLVVTTVVAPSAAVALDRILSHLDEHQRELAHGLMFQSLLGAIQPVVGRQGARTFEVLAPKSAQ